ncbi:hypothetical protein BV20DRAFT_638902 [Pilatotrama ljubarskyi]|nr:hypothetical protein BV20DRAFT_638902 [Pilatotrama ljubarskyi]
MSISERLYIRWFPDEASEPTSTLVLTTPSRRFVDLRFFKSTDPSASPLTALEWGFAGRSVGTPTHGKWIHEISSRTEHPEGEADEGDMFPHPTLPDVELERGSMVHPETGEVREYEEAWKAVPVLAVGGPHDGKAVSILLEMRQDLLGRRGVIVRIGQYCQGIVRDGSKVSVQRWTWTDGMWTKVGQVGDFDIPCDATWTKLEEGETVERGGAVWDVKEVSLL